MESSTLHAKVVKRRAAAGALVAVTMTLLIGMAALSIDLGMLYSAKAEMQRSADAAALAAAWELLDEDRLAGTPSTAEEISDARQAAVRYVGYNPMLSETLQIGLNSNNLSDGDVLVGYLKDPSDRLEAMSFVDPLQFNTVFVRVRRDETHNGGVTLFFARVFGINSVGLSAQAAATFKDGAIGYRINSPDVTADLMPFALHVDQWTALLDGSGLQGDNYAYDADTNTFMPGSDGIPEINVYPGGGFDQLPPGNFGTVDIGSNNNSTADISRQIRSGVSQADLAFHGGEISLGVDGTLLLNGDTGISAAVKVDLEAIVGQPRAILLFSDVSGPGNNAMYTIVGFAGIRVADVQLTGPMWAKKVVMQPAFVVDETVVVGPGSGTSHFIYQPVQLVE